MLGRGVEDLQIGMELAGWVWMALPEIPRFHLNRIDVEIRDVDVAQALDAIEDRYGTSTARVIALQLECPWTGSLR